MAQACRTTDWVVCHGWPPDMATRRRPVALEASARFRHCGPN
jgi:hypothetical protein